MSLTTQTSADRPTLRQQLHEWVDASNADLIDDELNDILSIIASALREEHLKYRVYHPITLIEWLESQ